MKGYDVMGKGIFFTLLIMATSSIPLYAKNIGINIDNTLTKCKLSAVSTLDISSCYNTAIESWDQELNIQYKLLLKGQHKNVQSGFRNAQRDWIKYRDSEISAMQVFYRQETGTVWGIVMLESKMNIIRDKAIDLYRLRNSKNLSGESE
ncbi:DUF1311 domain-containing protein [Edwardsiella tarda]|uniref:lysozyme inhibitor LprI family protein n=1 Tax=Edwardsiella tarda TaxID=636 RepID=UPI00351CA769